MSWSPGRTPARRERKHYYARDLPPEIIGRQITVGGQNWPLRGTLQRIEPSPSGEDVARLTVLGRDGRVRVEVVDGGAGVLIHAAN